MDNDGNKVVWTVVIISAIAIIGLMFVSFMPSQTSNIKTAIGNQLSSFGNSNKGDSSSSSTVVGTNLLTGTSNVLTTVPNATGWADNGLPTYSPAETLQANQTYTVSCYLEPAKHDANICMNYPNGNMYGTIIPAGNKGLSTLTITLTPEEAKEPRYFWITFTRYQTDHSAVSYKGFKLEKGRKATPWTP